MDEAYEREKLLKENKDCDWAREIRRFRSFERRSNTRSNMSKDPNIIRHRFLISDDYIFESVYMREIKDKLSKEQFEFYSLLLKGYNVKECAKILNVSYITARRKIKTLKSIIEEVFKED